MCVTFGHAVDLLPARVGVGQEEVADLLESDERGRMRSVLELVGYDRLELFAKRLTVEYGRDALARLHLTHVLLDVGRPLQIASVLRIVRVDGLDELAVAGVDARRRGRRGLVIQYLC